MANGDTPDPSARFGPVPSADESAGAVTPPAPVSAPTQPPPEQGVPQGVPLTSGRLNVGDYLKTMTGQERNSLALISKYESQGKNVPNYMFQPGFTAEGYYQVTHTNWRHIAPVFGINATRPMGGSGADQAAVALYLMRRSGLQNWTNYNPRLRQAMASGEDGSKVWFGGGRPPAEAGGGDRFGGTAEAAEGPPGAMPSMRDEGGAPAAASPTTPAAPAQPLSWGSWKSAVGQNLQGLIEHPLSSTPEVPIDYTNRTVGGPQQPANPPPPALGPGQTYKDPRGWGMYLGEQYGAPVVGGLLGGAAATPLGLTGFGSIAGMTGSDYLVKKLNERLYPGWVDPEAPSATIQGVANDFASNLVGQMVGEKVISHVIGAGGLLKQAGEAAGKARTLAEDITKRAGAPPSPADIAAQQAAVEKTASRFEKPVAAEAAGQEADVDAAQQQAQAAAQAQSEQASTAAETQQTAAEAATTQAQKQAQASAKVAAAQAPRVAAEAQAQRAAAIEQSFNRTPQQQLALSRAAALEGKQAPADFLSSFYPDKDIKAMKPPQQRAAMADILSKSPEEQAAMREAARANPDVRQSLASRMAAAAGGKTPLGDLPANTVLQVHDAQSIFDDPKMLESLFPRDAKGNLQPMAGLGKGRLETLRLSYMNMVDKLGADAVKDAHQPYLEVMFPNTPLARAGSMAYFQRTLSQLDDSFYGGAARPAGALRHTILGTYPTREAAERFAGGHPDLTIQPTANGQWQLLHSQPVTGPLPRGTDLTGVPDPFSSTAMPGGPSPFMGQHQVPLSPTTTPEAAGQAALQSTHAAFGPEPGIPDPLQQHFPRQDLRLKTLAERDQMVDSLKQGMSASDHAALVDANQKYAASGLSDVKRNFQQAADRAVEGVQTKAANAIINDADSEAKKMGDAGKQLSQKIAAWKRQNMPPQQILKNITQEITGLPHDVAVKSLMNGEMPKGAKGWGMNFMTRRFPMYAMIAGINFLRGSNPSVWALSMLGYGALEKAQGGFRSFFLNALAKNPEMAKSMYEAVDAAGKGVTKGLFGTAASAWKPLGVLAAQTAVATSTAGFIERNDALLARNAQQAQQAQQQQQPGAAPGAAPGMGGAPNPAMAVPTPAAPGDFGTLTPAVPGVGPGVKSLQQQRFRDIAPVPSAADTAEKVSSAAASGKTPDITRELARGNVSIDEMKQTLQNVSNPDLGKMLDQVSLPDALSALELASPEERQMLMPLIEQRIRAEMPKIPNQTMQAKLAQRYQQLLNA